MKFKNKAKFFMPLLSLSVAISPICIIKTSNDVKSNTFEDSNFSYKVKEDNTVMVIGPATGVTNYSEIRIPDTVVNGLIEYKVTEIAENAFNKDSCNATINGSVYIGDNVRVIGNYAFHKQNIFGEIILPEEVDIIGEKAFAYLNKNGEKKTISLIQMPRRINEMIGRYLFYNINSNIKKLIFPEYININDKSFGSFSNLSIEYIYFPKKINYIPPACFRYVDYKFNQEKFWLPNLEKIGYDAFAHTTIKSKLILGKNLNNIEAAAFGYLSDDSLLQGCVYLNKTLTGRSGYSNNFHHDTFLETNEKNTNFTSAIIHKGGFNSEYSIEILRINESKRMDIGDGCFQVFADPNATIPTIQSVSISGDTNVYNNKLSLESSYTFSNEEYADSFINFKWERYNNGNWEIVGTNDYYLEQEIDSSWNGDKIRLTAEYNGVTVTSQEQTITVFEKSELQSVSITGLKDLYVVNEELILSVNPIFTNDFYDSKKIKYLWQISNETQTLYTSDERNINMVLDDLKYNLCKVKITVTYEEISLSAEGTLNVQREQSIIINKSITGIHSQYVIGESFSWSLEYETNINYDDVRPSNYYWEKYVNGSWQYISNSETLTGEIDDSWKNSKIRLRFEYDNNQYQTDEYTINVVDNIVPISISKVEIVGLKNEYKINEDINLEAIVTLSNGGVNTSEIGYKWEISKIAPNRNQEWEVIGNQRQLTINKIDESYLGCSIRFTPILNGVEDTQNRTNVVNDFKFNTQSSNTSSTSDKTNNNLWLIIIISSFVAILLIIILTIILVKRKNKNKLKNQTNFRQNVNIASKPQNRIPNNISNNMNNRRPNYNNVYSNNIRTNNIPQGINLNREKNIYYTANKNSRMYKSKT